MSCSKASLQTFVDWVKGPQQGFFVHVVTVTVQETPRGQAFPLRFVGALTYVPVRSIGGAPPEPGHPGARFSSYFQGNIVDTSTPGNIRHILVELFDPIEIVLETISGHSVTKTVTLKEGTCVPSGSSLTMETQGDDGESYQITLNKTTFILIPHQVKR